MPERFVLKWVIDAVAIAAPCGTQREAFQKAGELFDEHGPGLEIEIHLNNMSAVLFNKKWMHRWNQNGRLPPVGSEN
jgi:hypothetical protein